MDGGLSGDEDDATFAYRHSTPRRPADYPVSLIIQPLVG